MWRLELFASDPSNAAITWPQVVLGEEDNHVEAAQVNGDVRWHPPAGAQTSSACPKRGFTQDYAMRILHGLLEAFSKMTYRSPFPNSIKRAIVLEVYRLPGRRARRIAAALNLELRKVNQFLFYEGKSYYGLRQINYDWYPPSTSTVQPGPPDRPTITGPKSICRALSELPLIEATLKVRSLNLDIVELVFADEDFHLLDDQLKAEFSIRRAELMASKAPDKATSRISSAWLLIIALFIALSISIFVSNNRQNNGGQSPNPSLNQ